MFGEIHPIASDTLFIEGLKTAITYALIEAGFRAAGKKGKKRFYPKTVGASGRERQT